MNYLHNIKLPEELSFESLEEIQNMLQEQYDKIVMAFSTFEKDSDLAIEQAEKVIHQRFLGNPVALAESLSECLGHIYRISTLCEDSEIMYLIFNAIHFCPKLKSLSETDRKQYSGLKTIKQRRIVNRLRAVKDTLEKRIIAMQSKLKADSFRMRADQQNEVL